MYYFITISLIAILGFGLYVIYKLEQIKAQKQLEEKAEQKRLAQIQVLKEQERLKLEYEHRNKRYQLNTHKVRLILFDARKDLKKFIHLYQLIVVKNYWVNEPFYSKFYELLLVFEKNDFMIIDSNVKVITMNLRTKNNEVETSRAFEVYSSADIVDFTIRTSMENILQFKQEDAQNIVIAICIFILEKSVHYLSQEVSKTLVIELFYDYKKVQKIRKIAELINEKNSALLFVSDAFEQALSTVETYPYNDSEVPQQLQLAQELPQKFLQEF